MKNGLGKIQVSGGLVSLGLAIGDQFRLAVCSARVGSSLRQGPFGDDASGFEE